MRSCATMLWCTLLAFCVGCSQSSDTTPANSTSAPPSKTPADRKPEVTTATSEQPAVSPETTPPSAPVKRGPVSLGATPSTTDSSPSTTGDDTSEAASTATIMESLKPLQILMGKWDGKTRKQFDGFAAVDEPQWMWDLLTDRKQPALVMKSEKSPYFQTVRVT